MKSFLKDKTKEQNSYSSKFELKCHSFIRLFVQRIAFQKLANFNKILIPDLFIVQD